MRVTMTTSAALFLIATTVLANAADRTVVVKFPKGAMVTTLKGAVKGYDGVAYQIEAGAGQTMQLLFAPRNSSCYFNVFEPGASEAAHIGSTVGNEFGANPTKPGTYKAVVYLMRNAARRNETCRYQLSVEITGAPGGVSAGVSDLMMRDMCKGSSAPMYGVQPRAITLKQTIVATPDKGFAIDGTVDKGAEGVKKLRCIFKSDRTLDRVMAMTPDGE
jgi:hypothetical protein